MKFNEDATHANATVASAVNKITKRMCFIYMVSMSVKSRQGSEVSHKCRRQKSSATRCFQDVT